MEVKHRGPSDDQYAYFQFISQLLDYALNISLPADSMDWIECEYLETNMLRCLKEKSVQDNVQKMTCKPEFLVWFFLECPTKTALYHDAKGLRNIFIQEKLKAKQGDGLLERK